MDAFTLLVVGLLLVLLVWIVFLGKASPRTGLDQIGWKSAREITERREALESEDIQEMVAARNARRRARGEPEVTLEQLEFQVMAQLREDRERSEQRLATQRAKQLDERDLDELLEATNARRRAKGLPERTREEVEREFGAGPAEK